MIQPSFYKYLSLIKLIVWLLILLIDYMAINVFEDPIVAIWISLVWCFLFTRWASFFLFLFLQKVFKKKNVDWIESDSYKLSLLFWMYALLNIILIFLWYWSKLRWLLLLWAFLFILYLLLLDSNKNARKSE